MKKNRFQSLPFKCDLRRYVAGSPRGGMKSAREGSRGGGGGSGSGGGGGDGGFVSGRPLMLLHDITRAMCCHPSMRLLSLRSVPMMPARSVDFTTFTWQGGTTRIQFDPRA